MRIHLMRRSRVLRTHELVLGHEIEAEQEGLAVA